VGLKGVIFDLDGTIVEVPYDWSRIRSRLGVHEESILNYLSSLREPERSRKWQILRQYEDRATRQARLKWGIRPFLDWLRRERIKTALVTNNSSQNVDALVRKFRLAFDCIITRDSGLWKPSSAPLREALKQLGLKRNEVAAVGDSHFDILAASRAGIKNILLISRDKERFFGLEAIVYPSVAALQRGLARLHWNETGAA
jgi:HAD superfamily hydrolase (TIGR01509 family)